MEKPLWTPSPERVERASITDFRHLVEQKTGEALPDYAALHAWSAAQPADFWELYAEYSGVAFETPPEKIMSDDPIPHTKWFEGATLNYAQALLHPPTLADDNAANVTAVIAVDETGRERSLSYAELRLEVARCASALTRSGVGQGDKVAAYVCNVPEAVILLLACASVGAVFSSCSPDFGFDAALARFGQLEPKLLFASDGYSYNGQAFQTLPTVARLAEAMGGLSGVVLIPYRDLPESETYPGWRGWLEDAPPSPLAFAPLPFDHPLYVLYSSGTTGLPKAMVHRAGGALLTHHKEQRLHSDVRPGDVVFYFSTCGWMMWNWLVSVLAQGAAIVLYEGSPAHPDMGALWRLAARYGVTHFGTSARFIHGCKAVGAQVPELPKLRAVMSTGSPLSPAGFEWVYEAVKVMCIWRAFRGAPTS